MRRNVVSDCEDYNEDYNAEYNYPQGDPFIVHDDEIISSVVYRTVG